MSPCPSLLTSTATECGGGRRGDEAGQDLAEACWRIAPGWGGACRGNSYEESEGSIPSLWTDIVRRIRLRVLVRSPEWTHPRTCACQEAKELEDGYGGA